MTAAKVGKEEKNIILYFPSSIVGELKGKLAYPQK
jgi:hypothetical protein